MANRNGTIVLIHGLWMTPLSWEHWVDFHNDKRAPLLLVAGCKDHRKSKAVTDYEEYPERSHYTLGQAGWEQVADDLLFWAASHARDESLATAF